MGPFRDVPESRGSGLVLCSIEGASHTQGMPMVTDEIFHVREGEAVTALLEQTGEVSYTQTRLRKNY